MNKKQLQRVRILNHGVNLIEIFHNPRGPVVRFETDPMSLCKSVHRIESRLHRVFEKECNGEITDEQVDKAEASALKSLDRLLGFTALNIPIVINGDPRGYAIKIDDAWVKDHNVNIYRDFGGYGIIAPEF